MEHKTKEEMLDKHGVSECGNNGVKSAMDEYSKQECISFAQWMFANWRLVEDTANPEQLYNLYLQSKL